MKSRMKALSLGITAALLLGLAGGCAPAAETPPPAPTALYTPGTYTASAEGHHGAVSVSVTFSADGITEVTVGENEETPSIASAAIEAIPAKIVEGQTLAVDAVTGATETSLAITAAVADCVKQAGGDPAALNALPKPTEAPEESAKELTTDVLVIGGGGAGMAAALEADNAGADVILLEWMDFLGGDTGRAGGGIEAAGTRFQEANGIHDKPEDFYDFIMTRGVTYQNSNLLRVMTEQSVAAVEFLAALGSDMSVQVAGHGSPVARAHRPATGSAGQNIVQPMIAEIEKRGIQVLMQTRGTDLLEENGVVVGAKATNSAEKIEYVIHAKSVVIATGNFASNNAMCAQYDPRLAGMDTNSSPGSQGDGILMATAVGAALEHMELFRVTTNLSTKVADYIAVDQTGKRFMDEYHSADTIFVPGDDLHIRVNENRTEKHYWLLLDGTAKAAQEDLVKKYFTQGSYETADTLEALAAQIGVEPATLTATVADWNKAVEQGKDAAFGRTGGMDAPIGAGPYFAAKILPRIHNTAGGIRINETAQVLGESGSAIAGLYAAGEVTGGVHDGVSAVCDALVFGRIAGTSAGTSAAGK